PAPACTATAWPPATSSRTPEGVSATRYSRFLISRGTAMRIGLPELWQLRDATSSFDVAKKKPRPESGLKYNVETGGLVPRLSRREQRKRRRSRYRTIHKHPQPRHDNFVVMRHIRL